MEIERFFTAYKKENNTLSFCRLHNGYISIWKLIIFKVYGLYLRQIKFGRKPVFIPLFNLDIIRGL
jgi:hypothetical protein